MPASTSCARRTVVGLCVFASSEVHAWTSECRMLPTARRSHFGRTWMRHAESMLRNVDGLRSACRAASHSVPSIPNWARESDGSTNSPRFFDISTSARRISASCFVRKPRSVACSPFGLR